MPCARFNINGSPCIVSYSNAYRYKQFTFEMYSYFGPSKLKKDGELAKHSVGRVFYKVWQEWNKLSREEKEKTRI